MTLRSVFGMLSVATISFALAIGMVAHAGQNGPPNAPPGKAMILGGGAPDTDFFGDSPPASFCRWMGPFYHRADTSIGDVEQVLPIGGTLSQLNVRLHDDAGSTNDTQAWTFSVVINGDGACPDDAGKTVLSCTITGDTGGFPADAAEENCANTEDEVTVNAGDTMSVLARPSCKNSGDTCPATREVRWTVLYSPNPK